MPTGTGCARTSPSIEPKTPMTSAPLAGVSAHTVRLARNIGSATNHTAQYRYRSKRDRLGAATSRGIAWLAGTAGAPANALALDAPFAALFVPAPASSSPGLLS